MILLAVACEISRYASCTNTPASVEAPHPTPERVLAERFAREINEEQYQSRLAILRDRVRPRTRRSRSGRGSREHQCLCDQVPSFVPCGDHINRAVQTGSPLEVDLASFGPGVTFGFELGLKFRFGLELGFGLEFGFGEGEIDHEAESVGQLPCR